MKRSKPCLPRKMKKADIMKENKYVISAMNNLTGEREIVSNPNSRWKTEDLLKKARRDNARHRGHACYSLYRMRTYVDEKNLFKEMEPNK